MYKVAEITDAALKRRLVRHAGTSPASAKKSGDKVYGRVMRQLNSSKVKIKKSARRAKASEARDRFLAAHDSRASRAQTVLDYHARKDSGNSTVKIPKSKPTPSMAKGRFKKRHVGYAGALAAGAAGVVKLRKKYKEAYGDV